MEERRIGRERKVDFDDRILIGIVRGRRKWEEEEERSERVR